LQQACMCEMTWAGRIAFCGSDNSGAAVGILHRRESVLLLSDMRQRHKEDCQ
jgi:hypothetical protein